MPDPARGQRGSVFLYVLFFLVVVLSAGLLGYYYYTFYYMNPDPLLEEAWGKFENLSSITAELELPELKTVVAADLFKNTKSFSRITLATSGIGETNSEKLGLGAIVSAEDAYLQFSYSGLGGIEQQMQQSFPQLLQLETYKLIRPVLWGKRWLHVAIPSEMAQTVDQGPQKARGAKLDEEQIKELIQILRDGLIVRTYERGYELEGKKYRRIVFGLEKKQLLLFLDKVKDLDLEIDVADINAMVRFVDSVPNWDADLIEILVDNDSYIHSVAFSLPDLPKEVVKEKLNKEIAEKPGAGSFLQGYAEDLMAKFGAKKQRGELVYIGKLTLSNYDNVSAVQPPIEIVELETVLEKAQEEVLPMLGSMLGGSLGVPTQPENDELTPMDRNLPNLSQEKQSLPGATGVRGAQYKREDLITARAFLEELLSFFR